MTNITLSRLISMKNDLGILIVGEEEVEEQLTSITNDMQIRSHRSHWSGIVNDEKDISHLHWIEHDDASNSFLLTVDIDDASELESQEPVISDLWLDDEKLPREELWYSWRSRHVVRHLFDWISLMMVNRSREANAWERSPLVEVLAVEGKNLEVSMERLVGWWETTPEERWERENDEQNGEWHSTLNELNYRSNGCGSWLYTMN